MPILQDRDQSVPQEREPLEWSNGTLCSIPIRWVIFYARGIKHCSRGLRKGVEFQCSPGLCWTTHAI